MAALKSALILCLSAIITFGKSSYLKYYYVAHIYGILHITGSETAASCSQPLTSR